MSRRVLSSLSRVGVPVLALLSAMMAVPQAGHAVPSAAPSAPTLSALAGKSGDGVMRLHRKAGVSADVGPDVINCYLTVNTPRKEGTTVPRQVRVYAQVSCDFPIDEIQIGVALHFGGPLLPETFMAVAKPDTNFAFGDTVPTYCGVLAPFQGEAYAFVYNAGYTDEGGAFGPSITFTNCI